MSKDYYKTLGVPENADADAIKSSYRELVKKYHPDRNPGDNKAEDRFKEIGEAYDVLHDPKKRRQYDQLRKYGAYDPRRQNSGGFGGGAGGFQGNINMEDLLRGGMGDIFGDLFGGRRGHRRQVRPQTGQDITLTVSVDFLTVALGGKVKISVPGDGRCPVCKGSGGQPGTDFYQCTTCNGSGKVSQQQGGFAISRPCPICLGRGVVPRQPCERCHGTGRTPGDTAIMVNIPAGISEDKRIRIPGRGEAGEGGAPRGDLYVRVVPKSDATFRREGNNVITEEEISLTTAVLGGKLNTQTIHGEVSVTVPPGTQPGAKLRLKRKGIHNKAAGRTGDHQVLLRVTIPRKLTKKQRELFLKLAELI